MVLYSIMYGISTIISVLLVRDIFTLHIRILLLFVLSNFFLIIEILFWINLLFTDMHFFCFPRFFYYRLWLILLTIAVIVIIIIIWWGGISKIIIWFLLFLILIFFICIITTKTSFFLIWRSFLSLLFLWGATSHMLNLFFVSKIFF